VKGPAANGRRARGILRALAGCLALLAAGSALAVPYRPTDDTAILEHVPARSALERLAPLRAAVTQRPEALDPALELARGYIEIGRRESDPRFVAYAESTLAPWLAKREPPEPALVLQAIALQYLHQFDAALALLERALRRQPLDGQAWLTRAGLLELRGEFAESRRACARLVRTTDQITSLTCLTSVESRNGRLASSYETLNRLSGTDRWPPGEVRSWVLAGHADMAERLGDDRAAETDLRAALALSPADPYLRATYADFLIRLDRSPEVLTLLAGCEAQDPLLLRLAIAGRRTSSPDAPRWAQLYQDRIRAATRANDVTHKREQAMFLLDVEDDAVGALRAAASNWAAQREPVDIRIYARAAERAHSVSDRAVIAAWLDASHYEDRVLAVPVGTAAAAGP
jgi:tetratricopeptide (TPR) repeat protein